MRESIMVFINKTTASGGLTVSFLTVWSHYSNCIPLSILKTTLFPLVVLIISRNKESNSVLKNMFIYAWTVYLVSAAEYAFLAETGERMMHGNLSWGMYVAIGLLHFTAIFQFLSCLNFNQNNRFHLAFEYMGLAVAGYHFACGCGYWYKLFMLPQQYF